MFTKPIDPLEKPIWNHRYLGLRHKQELAKMALAQQMTAFVAQKTALENSMAASLENAAMAEEEEMPLQLPLRSQRSVCSRRVRARRRAASLRTCRRPFVTLQWSGCGLASVVASCWLRVWSEDRYDC